MKHLDKVAELYAKGLTQEQLEKELNLSRSSITKLISRGRDVGIIPRREPVTPQAKINNQLIKYNVARGTVSQMLLQMPEDARVWVMESVPRGATIAEFTASILLDAYHDEHSEG